MFRVYRLLDKQNSTKYVGYTSRTLHNRLKRHRSEFPDQRGQATIELIQETDTKEQAKALEILFTIQYNTLSPNGWNVALGHTNNDGSSLLESGRNTRFGIREKYVGEEEKRKSAAAKAVTDKCSKPVKCITTGIIYPSARACAKALNLQTSALSQVLRGKRPHTKGLKFEFYSVPK